MTRENVHYIKDEFSEHVKHEYVEVTDRKAVKGDIIVITSMAGAMDGESPYHVGDVGIALEDDDKHLGGVKVDFSVFDNDRVIADGIWFVGDIFRGRYAVLRPTHAIMFKGVMYEEVPAFADTAADTTELDAEPVTEPSSDTLDLIANLSRRVKELEDTAEMLTDDIVMLDERSQPLTKRKPCFTSDNITDYIRRCYE